MIRRFRLAALLVVACVAPAVAPAQAQAVPCADVAAYPGDDAPKAAIAQWMAYGASLRSIPRELPVMAALEDSSLTNLRSGDADSVGYFQMRVGIWNTGEYAGYPENPALQLEWFLDYADKERQARLAAGEPDPALDANLWGTWIADVMRPAEQYRGRYALRLDQARILIGAACTAAPGDPSAPAPVTAPPPAARADATAPVVALSGQRRQRALRAGAIILATRCPAEACAVAAVASIAFPKARRPARIALPARALAAGQSANLRFVPSRAVRRRIRAALRSRPSVKVTVRVVATDLAGNRTTSTRAVLVTG